MENPAQRENEIMQVMATDMDRYRSDGLDYELAHIRQDQEIEANPERAAFLPVLDLHPKQSLALLQATVEGRELVAAWNSSNGGFSVQLQRAQKIAGDFLEKLGDGRHQRSFMTRFNEQLTEKARLYIYNEITLDGPSFPPIAEPHAVRAFGASDIGADLIEEWGSTAPGRIGTIHARIARFRRSLDSQHDFESFLDWYESLKPNVITAVLRFLAK